MADTISFSIPEFSTYIGRILPLLDEQQRRIVIGGMVAAASSASVKSLAFHNRRSLRDATSAKRSQPPSRRGEKLALTATGFAKKVAVGNPLRIIILKLNQR